MPLDTLPDWLRALAGGVLGAIVGSYCATLLIRWPQGKAASAGRSRCDGCARPLGPSELIPLLSFAAAHGRCATCGARVDPLHPAVEGAAAAIGASVVLLLPGPAGWIGALFGWLLLTLALFDARHFWLPDRLVLTVALAACLPLAIGMPPGWIDRGIGGAVGFAGLTAIGWAYKRLRGREGLGGGDPKLVGALGLWLGWQGLPFLLFGASMAGIAAVLAMRLAGRSIGSADPVPFGTLLALAAWPLWLLMAGGWWPSG